MWTSCAPAVWTSVQLPACNSQPPRCPSHVHPFNCLAGCPQIPSDPKLLLTQPDAAQMSAFFLTNEERDVRRGLLQSGELGVHVSLLDLERWSVPEGRPAPMEEADQQLVAVRQQGGGGNVLWAAGNLSTV